MSLRDRRKIGWLVPGLLLLHSSVLAQEGRRLPTIEGGVLRIGVESGTAAPAQIWMSGGVFIGRKIDGAWDAGMRFGGMSRFGYGPEDQEWIREASQREWEARHEAWKRDQEWRREWSKSVAEAEREAWKRAEEQDRKFWRRADEFQREALKKEAEWHRERSKKIAEMEREAWKAQREDQVRDRGRVGRGSR
jgi:hypothetical protein